MPLIYTGGLYWRTLLEPKVCRLQDRAVIRLLEGINTLLLDHMKVKTIPDLYSGVVGVQVGPVSCQLRGVMISNSYNSIRINSVCLSIYRSVQLSVICLSILVCVIPSVCLSCFLRHHHRGLKCSLAVRQVAGQNSAFAMVALGPTIFLITGPVIKDQQLYRCDVAALLTLTAVEQEVERGLRTTQKNRSAAAPRRRRQEPQNETKLRAVWVARNGGPCPA